MIKLITAKQMREADAYTIANEPIASIDLMERAAVAFVDRMISLLPSRDVSFLICCGTGNNGGDGLAIARLLHKRGIRRVTVWIANFNKNKTEDFQTNRRRLKDLPIPVQELLPTDKLPDIQQDIIIDAMLGSGLNKAITGHWLSLAQHLNAANKRIIAVDIPTGMPADGVFTATDLSVIATDVITFQRPKISFLFPESARMMKKFHVVDIGLNEAFIEHFEADFIEVTPMDISLMLKERNPFSNKGTFGHAFILAGNEKTMGAALLSAEACLFTGAGLTTLCVPHSGFVAMNTRLPEVMLLERTAKIAVAKYNALAIGPGLGIDEKAVDLLKKMLFTDEILPMVLDADALNILAADKDLLDQLAPNTILTPHMKEFDRLFGASDNWFERVQKAKKEAVDRGLIILLKNRFTFIAVPEGKIYVNFTGNPGMSTGGMGDTLTGILVSLLAQGYTTREAAIVGCYLHGKAGDTVAEDGWAVIPPSVLIQKIPKVIGDLKREYI